MTTPRNKRISWNDHHMLLALVTSRRSPDPNTQVGACIISKDNRVLSLGYNGPPRGLPTSSMPWAREGKSLDETKYAYVMHAEANAILNTRANLTDSTLYVTMYPCNECTKLILSSRIKRVYFLSNPYKDSPSNKASERMLDMVDIPIDQHIWSKVPESLIEALTTL